MTKEGHTGNDANRHKNRFKTDVEIYQLDPEAIQYAISALQSGDMCLYFDPVKKVVILGGDKEDIRHYVKEMYARQYGKQKIALTIFRCRK